MSIIIQDVSAAEFAPYGDLIHADGTPDMIINQGKCGRYHDRAQIDLDGGQLGVSVFKSEARNLPYDLEMMERHPLGNQCFMPMTEYPFLAIVADDQDGAPALPKAFLIPSHMGINIHRNVWHGVLTPLHEPGLFAVIDRAFGDGNNLEEYFFDEPYQVILSPR